MRFVININFIGFEHCASSVMVIKALVFFLLCKKHLFGLFSSFHLNFLKLF